jgi:hypothetical protein
LKTFCYIIIKELKYNKMNHFTIETYEELQQTQQPKKSAGQKKIEKMFLLKYTLEKQERFHHQRYSKNRRILSEAQFHFYEKQNAYNELKNQLLKVEKELFEALRLTTDLDAKTKQEKQHVIKYKHEITKTKNEINYLEKIEYMKECVKRNETKEKEIQKKEKEENKKNPVLKYVAALPNEIKEIIHSYLPYKTRFVYLETLYNPFKLMKIISQENAKALLKVICMTPEYFSTLTTEEEQKQIFTEGSDYEPDYLCKNISECRLKLQYILQKMKRFHPAFAFNTEKMISILFTKNDTIDEFTI